MSVPCPCVTNQPEVHTNVICCHSAHPTKNTPSAISTRYPRNAITLLRLSLAGDYGGIRYALGLQPQPPHRLKTGGASSDRMFGQLPEERFDAGRSVARELPDPLLTVTRQEQPLILYPGSAGFNPQQSIAKSWTLHFLSRQGHAHLICGCQEPVIPPWSL
jgi:hypothetical protein